MLIFLAEIHFKSWNLDIASISDYYISNPENVYKLRQKASKYEAPAALFNTFLNPKSISNYYEVPSWLRSNY